MVKYQSLLNIKYYYVLILMTLPHEHLSFSFQQQQSQQSSQQNGTGIGIPTRRTFFNSLITTIATTATLTKDPKDASATYQDPITKIVLPSIGEIESAIPSQNWNSEDDPFLTMDLKTAFGRLDSKPDSIFYDSPRFVEHVDENAVKIISDYLKDRVLKPEDSVLDLCTSWTSHITKDTVKDFKLSRMAGLGMNEEEMRHNDVLTDYTLVDLNTEKKNYVDGGRLLPYDDATFDVVVCQLSIDYLTHPLEVMDEVGRVLKDGGRIVILFSNRLFLQKAVGLWTGADDVDHTYTVGSYLRFCNANFVDIRGHDLSTRKKSARGSNRESMIVGDPVYSVTAVKRS